MVKSSRCEAILHSRSLVLISRARMYARLSGSALLLAILQLSLLTCCSATIRADWQAEYSEGQFRVHTQVDPDRIQPAVRRLSRLQKQIEESLQIELSDQTVDLLIFSSQRQYRDYVAPRVPEAVNRPALFVKGPDALWVHVVYDNSWETNLRHEVTHAFLHASLPFLPLWLDEGLAEYFELPESAKGVNRKYSGNLVWRMRLRRGLPTSDLEQLQSLTEMRPDDYRDSWAWVYFCLHSSNETRTLLQNYLQTIQREEVPGAFFRYLTAGYPSAVATAERFYRSW